MPSIISKSVLAAVLAACALLASGKASAQYGGATSITGTGGTTGTGNVSASSFTVNFESWNGSQWVQMTSITQQYFFNQARCLCGADPNAEFRVAIQAGTGVSTQITNTLGTSLENGGQGLAYLFVGTTNYDCLTPYSVGNGYSPADYCTNLLDPNNYPGISFTMSAIAAQNVWVSDPIPVARLFGAYNGCGPLKSCDSTSDCTTTNNTVSLLFWAQTNNGSGPDFDAPSASLSVVGTVPVAPTMGTVQGGNEALIVNWNWPSGVNISNDTTLQGVQLFCQRGANTQVYKKGTFGAAYSSVATVCPTAAPATTTTTGLFGNADPLYLCSGLIPTTTGSYRITGLQNGIPYGVGVAAVDKYENISAISGPVYGTPIPTVDFYSEYRSDGGTALGGYCTLDRWHARPGALALFFVVGLGLILVLRKRGNRRRRGPPGSGTLVLVFATSALAAGQARAQGIYHDNSFVEDKSLEPWNGTPRDYAIEARFGLYTPNVDSAFGGKAPAQPNAFIFGNEKRPMFQMEFDWEILQEFGTLAVAGAIGYYKENAWACKQIELLADPTTCARSGDNTSLRLIPVAALLVYRMDEAARQWKIPLVPYGKIGLNYTFWTVNDGNGNVPDYTGGGRGQGGTAGWQAAVGMSLLLDFLDPGAARTFDADSGVNHTYAFFELDHIDGSGLGRKNVLRVGDDTWFTGLMFEF